MKEKYSERASVDEAIISHLIVEKERTGLGPSKILRYMRSRGLKPLGSNLKVAQMESWLTGLSRSAPKTDIEAVFCAYAEIVYETAFSKPPTENQLILICDKLRAELRCTLAGRSNSCRRVFLKGRHTPKGLTEYRLQRLAKGEDQTILAAHLEHIRQVASDYSA